MNFFNRLQGVFFSPQLTLKSVSDRPVWVDAFIVLLILVAIFSYIVVPYAQKDQVQAMKNNVQLQERMGREAYERYLERMENPSPAMKIGARFIFPILANLVGIFFPGLIILLIGRMFSSEGNYKQVLSVYLHAGFVDKILGNAVRLPLILIRKSVVQTTTSLAFLFPKMETTSLGFRVLSQFDLFQLWLFGILAFGLSAVFKINLRKALVISYGFWLLKSLLYVGASFLSPGM